MEINPKTDSLHDNLANLRQENDRLIHENQQLRALLHQHGIQDPFFQEPTRPVISPNTLPPASEKPPITKRSPSEEKIALFLSFFCGREDVYAKQWQSKDGRIGYSPACKNEWQHGLCGKPKQKCSDCKNASYRPYDAEAIRAHLGGQCIAGIYPLRKDDTCTFLAIDFDEENWREDIQAVSATCADLDVPCAIEISRSGNGAHLWFFFDQPIEAARARAFGSLILTLAMEKHARLAFSSYDRMFPNQDTIPKGGFGNLIALPFQIAAYKRGGCLFVDQDFHPFEDQWVFLSTMRKMTCEQVESFLSQRHAPPLGELRQDADDPESKPWRIKKTLLSTTDFPPMVQATIADRLYIAMDGLSDRAQNRIKRLAAFRNPQFYQAQAMRMPIWNKPRVICCAEYREQYLCLPRGCMEQFLDFADENNFQVAWSDERTMGRPIDVQFTGILREEQETALQALLAHNDGILSATTAFGKTVVGAALIAERKVNTLILVHRKQLLSQWKERLSSFLDIRESLPEAPKRRGRQKKREIIGTFGAGKDTRSGIIDIAIMQSMGISDAIKPWISEYGMVIVDECHHVPAISFEQVIKAVHAKYLYGLTATPTRQDGHHPILTMYLGGIRHRVDAKVQAEKRPFAHVMIPRFTGASFQLDQEAKTPTIGQYYTQIVEDDLRNHMIVDDVIACAKEGRNCLLPSERTRHIKALAELLSKQVDNVLVMTGGKTHAETLALWNQLKAAPTDKPLILCATGKYIGEGFDEARLDTLFLTMPISWHGTLAQYTGRLHRLYTGKHEVRVYDYIDSNAEMLEKMYHKRLKGYASIGYQVATERQGTEISSDIIYDQDSFQDSFIQDLSQARKSIVIVSPYVTMRRVRWLDSVLCQMVERRVYIIIITRPAHSFQGRAREAAQVALDYLQRMGVTMRCQEAIHQKYAIIDERVVWYGSINLLSFGASQESIMRLVSGSVARALQRE
ncbi:MAG: DEAD/DEAH box helicase family protein [Oscillospiraceae bacterium]|jgi:superfamily II DNA or RNA helicase|nr:DEAD/DEAH box helicase family protein [Oscillospiraceae bacterium]